jgi:hypothetical protein
MISFTSGKQFSLVDMGQRGLKEKAGSAAILSVHLSMGVFTGLHIAESFHYKFISEKLENRDTPLGNTHPHREDCGILLFFR